MNEYKLINKWNFYIHLQNSTEWNIESYYNITEINNVSSAIVLHNYLGDELFKKTLFFVMKNNIEPLWENEHNKNGGSFSLKIHNKEVSRIWKIIYYKLIGETLCKNKDIMEKITGISNSPKKTFTILKIWTRDCENINSNIFNLDMVDLKTCIFKKHNPEY